MKIILSLFALFAIATAQEHEACAICRQNVDVLMNALNSEEAIAWQIQTLTEDGCSVAEDPAGCAAGVETWWALMAAEVYTHRTSEGICHGLDPHCHLPHPLAKPINPKEWDCPTCLHDVHALARLVDSEQGGHSIAHHLEGPAFCHSEELGLDEEQARVCVDYVRHGAVKGFQYIFKLVGEHAHQVCHEQYGVCDRPTSHAPRPSTPAPMI